MRAVLRNLGYDPRAVQVGAPKVLPFVVGFTIVIGLAACTTADSARSVRDLTRKMAARVLPPPVGIVLTPGRNNFFVQGYTLDYSGAIHPFGGAPAIKPSATWPGQDMADSIVSWDIP